VVEGEKTYVRFKSGVMPHLERREQLEKQVLNWQEWPDLTTPPIMTDSKKLRGSERKI
jgi:hypothetical protein